MPTEDRKSILRLALGVTGVFVLGLVLDWPLSFIGAVFTALFLQAPSALPLKAFVKLAVLAFLLMYSSWVIFSLLLPYPVVFLAVVAVAIILSFVWSVSGAGVLPGVLALMAAMMVPNVAVLSPELSHILATWVPLNLLIAGFAAALLFTLIPAKKAVPDAKEESVAPEYDPARRVLRISLVTVPFAIVFFVLESSALLVLFFVALLAQQLAAAPGAGKSVAKGLLTANILGALVSMVCYEINVIVPSVVTSMLLCFWVCLFFGTVGKSNGPLAPVAGSVITTMLVVYGGSIAPFSDEADVKSLTRVLQISFAAFFVIVAYFVVDEFWPEREKSGAT